MAGFDREPDYVHGTTAGVAVLLVNLGTPLAPTTTAVRRFLREFLSDPRVVELPRLVWWLILNCVVLAVRPKRSAAKYSRIWSAEGSPLKVHTERQSSMLAGYLKEKVRTPITVKCAMRYGEPSIPDVLARLKADGCDRILVLPLYPQYAASVTATAVDEIGRFLQRTRNIPEMRVIKHFHDHPAYIAALSNQIREYWRVAGHPDKLLMSFHGLPRYTLDHGDPYYCECQKSARLLAESLGMEDGEWQITFQSRFGGSKWLQPYTSTTLCALGKARTRRVDVVCPGFVADCLETLEEIGIEGRETFLEAGGTEFHLLPCLNERADWISALAAITLEHLAGWIDHLPNRSESTSKTEASRRRALSLGAPR